MISKDPRKNFVLALSIFTGCADSPAQAAFPERPEYATPKAYPTNPAPKATVIGDQIVDDYKLEVTLDGIPEYPATPLGASAVTERCFDFKGFKNGIPVLDDKGNLSKETIDLPAWKAPGVIFEQVVYCGDSDDAFISATPAKYRKFLFEVNQIKLKDFGLEEGQKLTGIYLDLDNKDIVVPPETRKINEAGFPLKWGAHPYDPERMVIYLSVGDGMKPEDALQAAISFIEEYKIGHIKDGNLTLRFSGTDMFGEMASMKSLALQTGRTSDIEDPRQPAINRFTIGGLVQPAPKEKAEPK